MNARAGTRLHIGQVARESGLSPKTIRYYESVGLLAPAFRATNGYRLFDPAVLERLRFMRRAQTLGLALKDIRSVLQIRDQGRAPCQHILGLIRDQIGAIDAQMGRLTELRSELIALLARLEGAMSELPQEGQVCPCLDGELWPTPPIGLTSVPISLKGVTDA